MSNSLNNYKDASNVISISNINKRDRISDLKRVNYIRDVILSNDHKFYEIFYNHTSIEDLETSKEVKISNLSNLLKDLSIQFAYDIEPLMELINAKHAHLIGISFSLLKENMLEWLENRQKVLSNNIFVSDSNNSYNNCNVEDNDDLNNSKNEKDNNSAKMFDFSNDIDVNMIILHRTLYLLKRKFNDNDFEIKEIYKEYNINNLNTSKNKNNNNNNNVYESNIEDFMNILETVSLKAGFSFTEISKPNDLLKVEVLEKINKEKLALIYSEINNFAKTHRTRYNDIIIEKKGYNIKSNCIDDNNIKDSNHNSKNDEFASKINDNINNIENNNIINECKDININNENNDNIDSSQIQLNNSKEINTNNSNQKNISNHTLNQKSKINETLKSNLSKKSIISKDNSSFENSNINNNLNKSIIKNSSKESLKDNTNESKLLDISNDNNDNADKSINEKYLNSDANKSNIKDSSKILPTQLLIYLEALPLIIADFIQYHSGIVIVDTNSQFTSELRTLFDNEIIQRLGEDAKISLEQERIAKLKELLFERLNFDNNLKVYEDLLLKKRSKGENTIFIEGMLQKLKLQRDVIDNEIKKLQDIETENHFDKTMFNSIKDTRYCNINNKSNILSNTNNKIKIKNINTNIINTSYDNDKSIILNLEDKRRSALSHIFYFYSKQHFYTGKTFEEIKNKQNQLDLGEFMKFCLEFKIPCKKEVLVEVFKKTAGDTRHMTFDEFLISINNISVKINEDRINLLYDRIKKLDNLGKTKMKNKDDYLKRKRFMSITVIDDRFENVINKQNINSSNNEIININKNNNAQSSKELENNTKSIEKKNSNINDKDQTNININSSNNNKEQTSNNPKSNYKNENNSNNADIINNNNKLNYSNEELTNQTTSTLKSPTKLSIKYNNKRKNSLSKEKEDELKTEISNEKLKIKTLIKELKLKKYDTLKEELLIYLEIDCDKKYQNKMKGFVIPFSCHTKSNRIPDDVITKNINTKRSRVDPQTSKEIRRIIQKRKEEKIRNEIEKERILKLKYIEERKKLQKLNESKKKDLDRIAVKDSVSYTEIKKKEINFEREKSYKITWDMLETLNPDYFVTNKEDDFNPKDLIDDNNNSDKENEELLNNMLNNRIVAKDNITNKNKGNFTTHRSSGFSNNLIVSNISDRQALAKIDNNSNSISNSNNNQQMNEIYCCGKNINLKGPKINSKEKKSNYTTKRVKIEYNPGIFENMVSSMNKALNYERKQDALKNNLLNHNSNLIKKSIDKVNQLTYNKSNKKIY